MARDQAKALSDEEFVWLKTIALIVRVFRARLSNEIFLKLWINWLLFLHLIVDTFVSKVAILSAAQLLINISILQFELTLQTCHIFVKDMRRDVTMPSKHICIAMADEFFTRSAIRIDPFHLLLFFLLSRDDCFFPQT